MGDSGSITVRCACGWEAAGAEDEVVAATVEHGRRLHNMEASRDEVLRMAVEGPRPVASDRADRADAGRAD